MENDWIDTFRTLYPTKIQYSSLFWKWGIIVKKLGWRLDYFVVSPDMMKMVKDSTIHQDLFGSDHCPIELKICLNNNEHVTKENEIKI